MGVVLASIIYLIVKGVASLFKTADGRETKESKSVVKPIPVQTPVDPKEEERKHFEYYRNLCHKVIDGVYSKRVIADTGCFELGEGRGRQFKNAKWFNARGIAVQYSSFIDYCYPIYFAFYSHEDVDAYFDKYIIATEQERNDIDAEYLAEMHSWENEQDKLYQAERAAEERRQIAERIKAKQRKRQLEKEVRQELIDSGELFGDKTKRPRIPREVVDAVWRKDGGRCVYCGSTENIQLDHIIPFSKGGATTVENLQLLCQKCNIEKSNKIG